MKDSHLVKVLKKLEKKEIRRLQEWVHSPFFNKNIKVQQLCKWLLAFFPAFDQKNCTREKAYEYIYAKQPYNAAQLNNLTSDLLQLLFKFLAYQNYQKNNAFEKICLMDELLAKDLPNSMVKIGKHFTKIKQHSTLEHSSSFFDNYLYYKQMDEYTLTQPTRNYNDNLQLKNNQLDLFYLATKLKIACDMASRNVVVQGNYEAHFLEEILARIDNNLALYQNYPAITVYYNVLKTIKEEENSVYYFQLKKILAENLVIFPKDELRILYDYARNYCIRKINKGNAEYYQEILNLYQFLLDKKIIFKNGFLTQWDYKNIVTVGVRLKEFEWTEQFIHQYKNQLPPHEQDNAFIYNLSSYHYECKNYKKSLLLLNEVKFTDASYYIGAKIIQLKSYYELEESDAFYALIEAFRIYLVRNRQLSDYRKRANLNFLKFVQKIYQ